MKKFFKFRFVSGTIILMMAMSVSLQAQVKEAKETKEETKPIKLNPVYLGDTHINSGGLSLGDFLVHISKGLHTNDTLHQDDTVMSFEVIVEAKNLYEDAEGDPLILTDLFVEPCSGAFVTQSVGDYFERKLKSTDSVSFEKIIIKRPGVGMIAGQTFKIGITSDY